jgi:hypothetical protein
MICPKQIRTDTPNTASYLERRICDRIVERWGKGEGDWARRRTTKLGRKIEDEVGVCEG